MDRRETEALVQLLIGQALQVFALPQIRDNGKRYVVALFVRRTSTAAGCRRFAGRGSLPLIRRHQLIDARAADIAGCNHGSSVYRMGRRQSLDLAVRVSQRERLAGEFLRGKPM